MKQLFSPPHHHGDVVAAADSLVDFLRGVYLDPVNLHHNVPWKHASSENNYVYNVNRSSSYAVSILSTRSFPYIRGTHRRFPAENKSLIEYC